MGCVPNVTLYGHMVSSGSAGVSMLPRAQKLSRHVSWLMEGRGGASSNGVKRLKFHLEVPSSTAHLV